jgi:hypothetical protein
MAPTGTSEWSKPDSNRRPPGCDIDKPAGCDADSAFLSDVGRC